MGWLRGNPVVDTVVRREGGRRVREGGREVGKWKRGGLNERAVGSFLNILNSKRNVLSRAYIPRLLSELPI